MASASTTQRRPVALVVEDDMLLAFALVHDLDAAGFDTLGPAKDAQVARQLLDDKANPSPDVAVLDYDLGEGATSGGIIARLERDGVPCVIASGQGGRVRHDGFSDVRILDKPVEPTLLKQAVTRAVSEDRRGRADAAD